MAFSASEAAGYITGVVVDVDGYAIKIRIDGILWH